MSRSRLIMPDAERDYDEYPEGGSGTAREAPGGKPTAQADIGTLQQEAQPAPRHLCPWCDAPVAAPDTFCATCEGRLGVELRALRLFAIPKDRPPSHYDARIEIRIGGEDGPVLCELGVARLGEAARAAGRSWADSERLAVAAIVERFNRRAGE